MIDISKLSTADRFEAGKALAAIWEAHGLIKKIKSDQPGFDKAADLLMQALAAFMPRDGNAGGAGK